jgi:hypothetical protein
MANGRLSLETELCTCGHIQEDHAFDWEAAIFGAEPCEHCDCLNYWPESRRAEQERRRAFLRSLNV